MAASRSDALVLFGVTGDLAHKMIIPAPYALAKRGALRVRPCGRGSWGPKEADALVAADGGWHNPRPTEMAG
jgi:glucose-6-phosphate 1-dehydrogenase